jgi:predicted DNA-binding transcriptional regulator AlpA
MSQCSTGLGHDGVRPGKSERLVGFKQLRPEWGIDYSREHLARLVKVGRFPRPLVLSADEKGKPKKIAWLESEIDNWITELRAKRTMEVVAE